MGEIKEMEAMLTTLESNKDEDDKKDTKDGEKTVPQKTWKEKWDYIRKNITIEPIMFCYVLPSVMTGMAVQNLNLEKACRVNLEFSDEVCTSLAARITANYTEQETQIQQIVTEMAAWKTLVQCCFPVILMLFMGSWSDKFGMRKPLILAPIMGELLSSVVLILCTFFFYELPMEVAGFGEAVFPSLTGGWFIMFMASFAYIADISSVEERTIRIGAVNILISLSVSIGLGLSGILYKKIGFYGVFSTAAAMYLFGFFYGLLRIEEEPKVPVDENGKKLSKIKTFFDTKQIVDTFHIVFKSGARNRKMRVIMIMIVVMVVIGPLHGEIVITYLFTRYKFNWDEVDYSMFSTFCTVSSLLGTIFSLSFFTQYLKIDDALLGVISSTSKILSSFVFAFAPTTLIFYLGSLVEILNGTSFIAMRSIVSKLVPSDELGKVMSVFGVCEALMPLIYGPMYSLIYRYTMDTMPGLYFLLGGALTCPAIFIFFWLYKEHKQDLIEEEELKKNGKELKPLNTKETQLV